MFVVGIIYRNEAHKAKIIPPTESGIPINAEIVSVFNPSNYIERATISSKVPHLCIGERLTRPTENIWGRTSGTNCLLRPCSDGTLIWPFHWQYGFNQNLAVPSLNVSVRSTTVDRVELPAQTRAGLQSRRNSKRALWLAEVEIADVNLRTLLEYQRFFRSLGLPFHDVSLARDVSQGLHGRQNTADSYNDQEHRRDICRTKKSAEIAIRFAGGCYCLLFGCSCIYGQPRGNSLRLRLRGIAGPALVGLGLAAFLFPEYYNRACYDEYPDNPWPATLGSPTLHDSNTVPQKYTLMTSNYWDTLSAGEGTNLANVLDKSKQVQVISALAEGSGIRQIEGMTGGSDYRDVSRKNGLGSRRRSFRASRASESAKGLCMGARYG
jgi:hypothetical protein